MLKLAYLTTCETRSDGIPIRSDSGLHTKCFEQRGDPIRCASVSLMNSSGRKRCPLGLWHLEIMCKQCHVGREVVDTQAECKHVCHQHSFRLARDLHSAKSPRLSAIKRGWKGQDSLARISLALSEPRQQAIDDGLRHARELLLQRLLVVHGARGVPECHHRRDVHYDLSAKLSAPTFSVDRCQRTDRFSATSAPGTEGAGVD